MSVLLALIGFMFALTLRRMGYVRRAHREGQLFEIEPLVWAGGWGIGGTVFGLFLGIIHL